MNHEDGYVILRNFIEPDVVKAMYKNMKDKEVNYTKMKTIIDNILHTKINPTMDWDANYVKFRISDNNNSADSSAFHRDVFSQTYKNEVLPCFTCVMYLDKTIMEIIPGTHKTSFIPYSEMWNTHSKIQQVTLEPGDVLIFYSTLMHRGIFTEGLKHRRVIQIFEMFSNREDFQKYGDKIIYKLGNEKYSMFMQIMSKHALPLYFWNIGGFLNSAQGYGILKNCNIPDMEYISPEGLTHRIDIKPDTWQPINKYLVFEKTRTLPEECVKEHDFVCYNRQGWLYLFLFCLF